MSMLNLDNITVGLPAGVEGTSVVVDNLVFVAAAALTAVVGASSG